MTPSRDRALREALEHLTEVDQRLPVGDFISLINAALDRDDNSRTALGDSDGLREAARAMWFAHTEDERFAGPVSDDPYGDFEEALLAALRASGSQEDRQPEEDG